MKLRLGSIEFDLAKYIPEVERIIYHEPATIVFWSDGTKTVVKCMKEQEFNKYYGFIAALAKRVFGSNSAVERIIRKYGEEDT